MKEHLLGLLPNSWIERNQVYRSMKEWSQRNYLENSPQLVKQKVLEKYGIKDAIWIETGTYMGATTDFLRKRCPQIHTIEPCPELFKKAYRRFEGENVFLYNDLSENVLPSLLPSIKGNVNFWLDGHYSAGVTFKGPKVCPVEDELSAIEANFYNFNDMAILIDDVRCFLPSNLEYHDYPSIDYLVDWARRFEMRWRVEHDIFVMQSS